MLGDQRLALEGGRDDRRREVVVVVFAARAPDRRLRALEFALDDSLDILGIHGLLWVGPGEKRRGPRGDPVGAFMPPPDALGDMSLAAETRRAAREHPFLVSALRAGVVNYTAAARFLDVGDAEAVATALRRYAEELPDYEPGPRKARITMESGVGPADEAEPLLSVGGTALAAGGGDRTAVLATGDVDSAALRTVLATLAVEDVAVHAAGVGGDALAVVVDRRAGSNALRTVESALESVP